MNLPNETEREDIFRVHIKKKDSSKNTEGNGCQVKGIDYNKLAKATQGFNGADIEAVVNEAVECCFLKAQVLSTDIIVRIANEVM